MKFLKNIAIKRKLKTRNFLNFGAIWINAVLIFLSVSFFASAEPIYLNSDITLNSTQVSGNQTIGHYVISSSNIIINLSSSILTRNLAWFDGSTIFSSNGFQNVTIKDGVLNWSDFGVVRPFGWYVDNQSWQYGTPDGTVSVPFYLYLINGLNSSIKLIDFTTSGQCYTPYRELRFVDTEWTISGNLSYLTATSTNPSGFPPPAYGFLCSGNINISQPYNFFINITYNDSTNIRFIQGNITGRFGEVRVIYSEKDMHIFSQDLILTNSEIRLINVTYSSSKYFWTNFSDSASNLSVGWYLDVQVNDSNNNPISGANVTATDKNNKNYNITTDSNGNARFPLPEYVENYTTKDFKSNYTVIATYGGLTDTKSVNLTGNTAITLTLNNTAPTVNLISINGSGNNSYTNNPRPNIRFNFTDAEQITASCDILINNTAGFGTNNSVQNNTNTTITITQSLSDKAYNLSVRCNDGISYGDSGTWRFTVDTVPPQITNYELIVQGESPTTANNVFISPQTSQYVKDGVRINVSASEEVDWDISILNSTGSRVTTVWGGYTYKVNDVSPSSCYWNGTSQACSGSYLPDGIYTINVTLEDMAGNRIENTTKTITIDSTLPQATNLQKSTSAIYRYTNVTFNATWTDVNLSVYVFSINQTGTWVNSSFINFSGNNVSNYAIQINASRRTVVYWKFYAQDLAGNWNSTEEQSFEVLQTLSIFIDRNSWDLGLIPRNSTYIMNSTTRINVTNDGDGNQNYTLRILSVAPSNWTPSDSPANNTFVMSGIFVNSSITPGVDFFNNDSNNDDVITALKTANSTTFAWTGSSMGGYSVQSGNSTFLWLRFDAPVSVSSKEQHNITIQIGAVAA